MGVSALAGDIGRRMKYEIDRRTGNDIPDAAAAWGYREPKEGGMSNEVWITEAGDVAKSMNPLPGTALMTAVSNTLFGSGGYPSYRQRAANEERINELVEGTSLETAEHYESVGAVSRWEHKDHVPFKVWAADADPESVYRAAYRFGSDLRRIHNNGHAWTDLRLANLGIDADRAAAPTKPAFLEQDPVQIMFDAEYAKTGAQAGDKKMDLITLTSSARHLAPDQYDQFTAGLEDGYGIEISDDVQAKANLTSKLHARYLEQRPDWEENAYENAAETDGIYGHLDRVVDAVIATDQQYGLFQKIVGNGKNPR